MHTLNWANLKRVLSYYTRAARRRSDEFTSPLYWMKAGNVYERLGNYSRAIEAYNRSGKIILKARKAGRLKNILPGSRWN
jgi:tetratricopeptide (TPR) repeat protein